MHIFIFLISKPEVACDTGFIVLDGSAVILIFYQTRGGRERIVKLNFKA